MNTTTVAVDLAKQVFAVCVGDAHGHGGKTTVFKRAEFLAWLKTLPAGTPVAMEACGTAHYWARTLLALGLVPRIMAAEFVKPYRKNQRVKNDSRDAEAILAALHAPGMRFVTPKTEAQQQRLCWHRLHEGYKEERKALLNRIRGLLAELGYLAELGVAKLRRTLAQMLTPDEDGALAPEPLREMIQGVLAQLTALDARIEECSAHIARQSRLDPSVAALQKCPSIGPLIADALVATVGDARHFKNGRQFAASRGDSYLRGLLIHAAGAVLNAAIRKHTAQPEKLRGSQVLGRTFSRIIIPPGQTPVRPLEFIDEYGKLFHPF